MNTSIPPSSRGFTLIELLTVVAIVGILSCVLVPVVGSARDAASKAALTANYRQIGAAIALFSADNHGRYPGVRDDNISYDLLGGQMPYRIYQNAQQRTALQGPDHLGPYLAAQEISYNGAAYLYTPVLDCPKMRSKYSLAQSVTLKSTLLAKTLSADGSNASLIYPFGSSAPLNAMTSAQISSAIPVARRWLLHDYEPNDNNNPIHGSGYVTLFFDGHVESVSKEHMGANGLIQ